MPTFHSETIPGWVWLIVAAVVIAVIAWHFYSRHQREALRRGRVAFQRRNAAAFKAWQWLSRKDKTLKLTDKRSKPNPPD